MVPTIIAVTFIVFILVSTMPTNAAALLVGANGNKADIVRIEHSLHLDQPVLLQYWHWLLSAAHLDFGRSWSNGRSVASELSAGLPVTLMLVLSAVVIALVISLPLGTMAGLRPGGYADKFARIFAGLSYSIPGFWLALLLILLFGVKLRLLPVLGYVSPLDSPIGWAKHIAMPGFALAMPLCAVVLRQLRASMFDVLQSPYIQAVWARGGRVRTVAAKHALKNAATPVVTVLAVQIGTLLGGTVIVENIFSIPGIGARVLSGVLNADIPMLLGVVTAFVVAQVLLSLAADLCYGWLNPKVRIS
jgi:peptide/nickel transport system permease protein